MRAMLSTIPESSLIDLHGVIFVASCNISKKTADEFLNWAREAGILEAIIWDRSAIEDALYQPKNDHLLFAYFGISLKLRRRNVSAELRGRVALKRKLRKLLTKRGRTTVLLRDPDDARYPYVEGESLRAAKCLWLPALAGDLQHDGVSIIVREHAAYYDGETQEWDFASGVNYAIPYEHENRWRHLQVESSQAEGLSLHEFIASIKPSHRFELTFVGTLPYDEIVGIDDVGDDWVEYPTLFVSFRDGIPPFDRVFHLQFNQRESYSSGFNFHPEGHVRVFPDQFRALEWERGWFERNKIGYSIDPFDFARHEGRIAVPRD